MVEMENRGGSEPGAVRQAILIVEDEALLCLDAGEFLREGGYHVQEAAKAGDAMQSPK